MLTDSDGKIVWQNDVTPFGEETGASGFLERDGFYTGKKIDRDTGLYYFNTRWYDPELGRFITEDPVKDGVNWFSYCSNNPLIFIDPTGLTWQWSNVLKGFKATGEVAKRLPSTTAAGIKKSEAGLRAAGSVTMSNSPVLGDIKDIQEVVTGKDLVTGQILSKFERIITGIAAVLPIVTAPVAKKIGNAIEGLADAVDNAADASKKADGLDLNHSYNDGLSSSNYPNPDPAMDVPAVQYEPKTRDELSRMRQGKTPTDPDILGDQTIEAHHRQQKPVEDGGVIDEKTRETHRLNGNHTRHQNPSQLTAQQRRREIREHWKKRSSDYFDEGDGI